MEFPTIVYRCPGDHQRPGGTFSYRPVEDEKQLAEALDAGWHLSLPDAIAPPPVPAPASDVSAIAPSTRAELEQKAKELGIKFDGRTGDAKLLALIAEKLKV